MCHPRRIPVIISQIRVPIVIIESSWDGLLLFTEDLFPDQECQKLIGQETVREKAESSFNVSDPIRIKIRSLPFY